MHAGHWKSVISTGYQTIVDVIRMLCEKRIVRVMSLAYIYSTWWPSGCDFDLALACNSLCWWLVLYYTPCCMTIVRYYIAEENFEVTTPNPYRDRTHRIRIWSCFLQRLGNVCCDVTWYLPDRLWLLLVCFCPPLFSFFQHPSSRSFLFPLHPMDPLSKDSIETADHFIYVTQVYFCGTYSFHLTSSLGTHPRIL